MPPPVLPHIRPRLLCSIRKRCFSSVSLVLRLLARALSLLNCFLSSLAVSVDVRSSRFSLSVNVSGSVRETSSWYGVGEL